MGLREAYGKIRDASTTCTRCGRCRLRCEVLKTVSMDVCELAGAFANLASKGIDTPAHDLQGTVALGITPGASTLPLAVELDIEAYAAAVRAFAHEHPEVVFAVRRCCMCGLCTRTCATGVDAYMVFSAIREVLFEAGVTSMAGHESTRVDEEWDLFKAYRAIYGFFYEDTPRIDAARSLDVDTLFYPGCTLVSYAPELTLEIVDWLGAHGHPCVMSEACCGSPLISTGAGDRAHAFRVAQARAIRDAGIKHIVFVCPGCFRELMDCDGILDEVEFIGLPSLLAEEGVTLRADKVGDARVLSIADSCHDVAEQFSMPLRKLAEGFDLVEHAHCGGDALCCGAGGSTVLVDEEIGGRRLERIIEEGREAGSDLIIADCPTCSYTFAAHEMSGGPAGDDRLSNVNYLDLVFENRFDWYDIFNRLNGMYTGEYADWVNQVLS